MYTRSFKLKIRSFLWKVLGSHDTSSEVKDLKEQIKTLQFFLNSFHDIQNVPPTSDEDLRLLQLCDTQLLVMIDKLCKKHNLQYWIDYGTLLGAYRHKGFIPWDDDTDLAMPRDDYNQFVNIVNYELSKYGIEAEENEGRIGFGYAHQKTGIWVDILPVEIYNTNNSFEEDSNKIISVITEYNNSILKKKEQFILNNLVNRIIEELSSSTIIDTKVIHRYLYHCPRFSYSRPALHKYEDIFPLSLINFEGEILYAPHHIDIYLERCYSNNYMLFPKSGVLHHGAGRKPLSTWAKENEINMKEVLEKLKSITSSI